MLKNNQILVIFFFILLNILRRIQIWPFGMINVKCLTAKLGLCKNLIFYRFADVLMNGKYCVMTPFFTISEENMFFCHS